MTLQGMVENAVGSGEVLMDPELAFLVVAEAYQLKGYEEAIKAIKEAQARTKMGSAVDNLSEAISIIRELPHPIPKLSDEIK